MKYIFAGLLPLAMLMAGCATTDAERAFDGKFSHKKETRVITEYCQNCHTHQAFNPYSHMQVIVHEYRNEPYVSATDCKTCHGLTRDIWNDLVRITHYPDGKRRDHR